MKKHILKLVLWILFAAASVYTVFMGLIVNYDIVLEGAYFARLGIDLRGGMRAVLTPELEEGENTGITNDQLNAAITVINMRLDGKGIFDRRVMADYSNKRAIVEIPWATGETEFNPEAIAKEIGETAVLTFAAVEEVERSEEAPLGFKQKGEVLVHGKDVVDAYPIRDEKNVNNFAIALQFNSEGTKDFENATRALQKQRLGILLDGVVISCPEVNDVITAGSATISGTFTLEEAQSLSNQIRSGSLPFKLVIGEGELRTITPILGENALNVAMNAGLVALVIILLFLLIYYRVPGLVACIALVARVSIHVLFLVWFGVSLTLPGMAGIILTIGMGVDANIIVFERIKEEIRKGKNMTSTIRDGFKNALSAILDCNITTIMCAIVLYYFGTGPIRGFAVTFIIGIIINVITSLWMSWSMLTSIDKLSIIKNVWWYAVKSDKKINTIEAPVNAEEGAE